MNKKFKMLSSALVLCSSMLMIIPANADTKNITTSSSIEIKKNDLNNNFINNNVILGKLNPVIKTESGEMIPIKGDDVCLRKKPGIHSVILRQLNESDGDEVAYIDYELTYKDGYSWAHVSYFTRHDRIDGYVATEYLH